MTDQLDALVMPGESILVRVYLDKELDDSDAVHPEILFDDVRAAMAEQFQIELVGKG